MNISATKTPAGGARIGSNSGLGRLARWCYAKRRRVVLLWVVGLIVITGASQVWHGVFANKFNGGNSESAQAQSLLAHRFPTQAGDDAQVVFRTADPVTSPAVRRITETLGLNGPTGRRRAAVRSIRVEARRSAVTATSPTAPCSSTRRPRTCPRPSIQTVIDTPTPTRGPASWSSSAVADRKVQTVPFGPSEGVGILAAIIILLLAFGSVIAMGLPIVTALFGIGIGIGVVDFVSHVLIVPTFGPELAAMIGIGVGIDYALFIVTRYREGLSEGCSPSDAVVASLRHRRPGGALRRLHRGHLAARHVPARPAVHLRPRHRVHRGRGAW